MSARHARTRDSESSYILLRSHLLTRYSDKAYLRAMKMGRATTIIALIAILGASRAVEGQQKTIPRVGVISAVTREAHVPWADAFREGLRDLGYVEGQNIALEWRYADGRAERFQELAEDLVRLKVDVIVAANQPGVQAAQKATTTIPIVMVLLAQDPVRGGFVA